MPPPPPAEPATPGEGPAPDPPRNPWWIPRFLGRVPALEPRALRTLGLVSTGMMFENYDIGLVNAALKQIAESLAIPAEDTGFFLGAIRVGGLGTFLLLPFADRIGRRRMFLVAFVGMSVGTLATGLSQTPVQFAAFQMFTRIFMLTAAALAVVFLVEEMPAEERGWAIGTMSALGGLGYGLGAMLYSVVDWLPFGWRALYAVGIVPLLLLPLFRRELQETRRFELHREGSPREGGGLRAWLAPMRELLRQHPRRVLGVGLAGVFGSMGSIAVFQYTSFFVQEFHGWAPWQFALLFVAGGLIGLLGNLVGGRLADRVGRRRVGSGVYLLGPLWAFLFYHGPEASLVLAFAGFVFSMAAGDVVLRAFAAELFPTGQRGTSSGWLIGVQTVGWSSGLFLVGFWTADPSGLALAVSLTSLAAWLAGGALLLLPETGSRELETISSAA